ncbi:TonB-dependent siderophore receptor [Roseibium algae]|uniref:TonB-dependent siderophore receptor n=1 Tax=Roseibium algae TaxID=3123038 RepID=A0ABU8TIF0_9HYPH
MLKYSGLITAALLLAVEGAAVQGANGQEITALEAVVVKGDGGADDDRDTIIARGSSVGSKTDTPILDVPASVSVVTEKEMSQRAVENLDEALAYTSGVVTDIYGSDNRYDFYLIRGFYQTSLGSYLDGLPMRVPGFTGSRIEPYGMERIEVLKGSTSTLFGMNAPGGLVNAITKKPRPESFGEVYTTIGDDHVEAGTDFGGPIDAEGKWLYRFTTKAQDGSNGTDYSNDDRFYVAPSLTWRPTDSTELTFLANYYKRDGNTSHGIPLGSALDPDTYLGEPDFDKMDTEEWSVGYQFAHEFDNGLKFRQTLRYSDLDLTYESVYGGTTDPTANRSAWAVYGSTKRFAVDSNLQYDASFGAVDTRSLVGLDYYHEDVKEHRVFGSASGIDVYNPAYCGLSCITMPPGYHWDEQRSALGLYAQEELTFLDKFIVTLGGRYDRVKTDSSYPEYNLAYSATDEAFTSRVGLTYKLRDDLSVYANYSESFQPVSAEIALANSPEPQRGTQYEVGLKYQPSFMDALFTASVFDLTQTNVPYYINATTQAQVGEVRVRGLELEGKMALTDQLNMTLAYSYWDPEIMEDGNDGNVGNRPLLVPNNIASAWLDYKIPGRWRMNDLTIGAGVRYVGSTFADNANTIKLDARTLVDAMVSYELFDNASLQVNATNLLDERYIANVDTFTNTAYYGDSRAIKATFRYTW